jgi:5-methyltetrahydrofolate corrinoid/iron sulfur protein methyltransferase
MIRIADNLQITNKRVSEAVERMDLAPIQELVRLMEKNGAQAIDINSGPLNREPARKMKFLVEAVQEVTNLPLVLDTANPIAIEAGLSVCKNKRIINGVSLEPKKIETILPLANKFDAEIIGYLLLPDGHVPQSLDERLSLAIQLYQIYVDHGLDPKKLIIDPVLVPVMWQNGIVQAKDILDVIRQLPDVLGYPVQTVIGLSNLTAGQGYQKEKLLLERTYLSMLASAGLSMVLMNIFHTETVAVAKACNTIMNQTVFSWETGLI